MLTIDPAVPLFGEKPYPFGEGEAVHVKYPCTAFGQGGADPMCPDCLDPPPTGTWYIYNDPTWDFSADEPKKK